MTPWPPIRLTASRITVAPWPVFQSFTAGPSTDATASSSTKRTSGSLDGPVDAVRPALPGGPGEFGDVRKRGLLGGFEGPPLGAAGRHTLSSETRGRLLLERIELVEDARRREPERCRRLPGRPDIHQPVERILLLLQPELEPARAGLGGVAAAKPAPVVADDRVDGGEHLRRRHQAHGDPGPPEHRVDDLAVRAIRNDDAVADGVAADDPARRHAHGEHRVAGGRELVHQLAGAHARVEGPLVGLLEEDERGALDAVVGGGDGRRHEVRVAHTRDVAPALVNLKDRFLAGLPLGDAHLAVEDAGVDPGVRQRLGEHERAMPRVAQLPGPAGRDQPHVARALFAGAPLVDRRQGEHVAEHRRGRAGVDPCQLESREGDGEVLRPVDAPAVLRVDREDRESGRIEGLDEAGLVGRPRVRMPRAAGHEPRDRPPGDGARGQHDAAQVVAVREPPLHGADFIVWQASKHRQRPSVGGPGEAASNVLPVGVATQ